MDLERFELSCRSSDFPISSTSIYSIIKSFISQVMNSLVRYRMDCKFNFNLADYKEEFDFKLVKEYGWYSPSNKKNNLGGVSRDHMFSIREGFEMNIDPKILSHPANCQLLIHSKNISKHRKSSITLEELLTKIEEFDKKYNGE